MEQKPKLPPHEASGRKPLNGSYKVSFQIEMTAEDQVTLSDLTQALTEGFGETLIERVADLSVEKLSRSGKIAPSLKTGDLVRLTKNITVTATVLDDEGVYSVGLPTEDSKVVGDYEVVIPEGSHAVINQIAEDRVEIIELDKEAVVLFKDAETDDVFEDRASVDLISVNLDDVEKVGE